jgi:hypothetical protein
MGFGGSGGGFFIFDEEGIVQYNCKDISGEVLAKDDSDGFPKIYVEIEDGFAEEQNGYAIYVSPNTWDNTHIGDNYTKEICDINVYYGLQDTLKQLLESGILEGQ